MTEIKKPGNCRAFFNSAPLFIYLPGSAELSFFGPSERFRLSAAHMSAPRMTGSWNWRTALKVPDGIFEAAQPGLIHEAGLVGNQSVGV